MEGIEPGVLAGLSGAVLLLAGVVTAAGRRIAYRSGAADQRSGLPVYEVAMLAGGAERAAETALAYLVLAGLVEVRERASTVVLIAPQLASPEDHPAEAALLSTISLVGTRPNLPLSAARTAAQPLAAGLRGLLIPPGRSLLLQMLPGLTG
ncbi:MAG: TIGR04222 domain-containing membrane protein, partial [Acidimicrobiia bacterium]